MNAKYLSSSDGGTFVEEILGKEGAVALASALIFFKDFFIMVAGVHSEWIGIFMLACMAIYALFQNKRDFTLSLPHTLLILGTALIAGLSSLNTGAVNSSSYFASFFIATCIVVIGPQYFVKSLTLLMTLNFTIQIGEVLSGQFLFVYVDEEYEYDEKMLGVGEDSFRAKGFFPSPLNAISVAMSLAFLNPRSTYNWILLILSSSLGQGRLGLGVGTLGLLACLMQSKVNSPSQTMDRFKNVAIALATLVAAGALSVIFGSEESISRLLGAASSENSQNVSRLLIWGVSIDELLDYDPLSLLVGRFGHIKSVIGGTESDWLRLWLDNGLIFMMFYLVPLLMGAWRSLTQRHWPEAVAYLALMFVMAVYPHGQSMPNGTLVWLTILVTLYRQSHIIDSKLAKP